MSHLSDVLIFWRFDCHYFNNKDELSREDTTKGYNEFMMGKGCEVGGHCSGSEVAFVLFVRPGPFIAPSLRAHKRTRGGKYEKRHVGTSSSLAFESEKSLIDDDASPLRTHVDAIAR